MKYSNIKTLKTFCEGLFSEPCYREVIEEIENNSYDFKVGYSIKFIKTSGAEKTWLLLKNISLVKF